jgi:plastocyanin
MLTRRSIVLAAGGLALAGRSVPLARGAAREGDVVEIHMRSDPLGAEVWFDPIGVAVAPGTTVRWVVKDNVHTTTAYHPKNGGRALRIPEGAAPWDSGVLVNPGDRFEVTLMAEGVYDYFCIPHEMAGMVGRIVVGKPGGPGAGPFAASVPEAARRAFPSVEEIVRRRVVRRG